ncbi:MAG: hypothetical protein KDD63_07380 [Bacteroidetes bacterium]|nr:hypothetical protein [Bacteroidota bacterium]MCB0852023.1 hypothetical protein [Bacteroidota bacterium]
MNATDIKHPVLDYARIEFINQKGLRVFRKRIDPVSDFENLRTLHLQDDLSTYPVQEDRFDYSQDVESVWKHYIHKKPHEMWTGTLVKYLFTYSKTRRSPYYAEDPSVPLIHEGMQLFCLLNLAGPLGVVGMEVLKIDEDKKVIELAYIEGGIYRGLQRMEFIEQINGHTRVIHTSYYKAEGLLGKLIPYAYFHKKTVGEFHQNMKNLLLNH